jgi:hypothetical protein
MTPSSTVKNAPTNIFIIYMTPQQNHNDLFGFRVILLYSSLCSLDCLVVVPSSQSENVEKTALVALDLIVHLDGINESCLGIFTAANIILASAEWTKSAFENAPPCFDQYTA